MFGVVIKFRVSGIPPGAAPVTGGKEIFGMTSRAAILLIVGVLAAVACDEPTRITNPGGDPSVVDAEPIVIDPDRCPPFGLDSEPAAIEKIEISGDLLTITIEYSGGCDYHTFSLNTGRCFLESYPVQSDIFLVHDDPGDPCDAVVEEDRVFDLTPLKEAYWDSYGGRGDPVLLRVYPPDSWDNYEPMPRYEFGPR